MEEKSRLRQNTHFLRGIVVEGPKMWTFTTSGAQ